MGTCYGKILLNTETGWGEVREAPFFLHFLHCITYFAVLAMLPLHAAFFTERGEENLLLSGACKG